MFLLLPPKLGVEVAAPKPKLGAALVVVPNDSGALVVVPKPPNVEVPKAGAALLVPKPKLGVA